MSVDFISIQKNPFCIITVFPESISDSKKKKIPLFFSSLKIAHASLNEPEKCTEIVVSMTALSDRRH